MIFLSMKDAGYVSIEFLQGYFLGYDFTHLDGEQGWIFSPLWVFITMQVVWFSRRFPALQCISADGYYPKQNVPLWGLRGGAKKFQKTCHMILIGRNSWIQLVFPLSFPICRPEGWLSVDCLSQVLQKVGYWSSLNQTGNTFFKKIIMC